MRLRNVVLAGALLAVSLVFAGCFTTKFTLGKLEDAKVDLGYVGNWQYTGGDAASGEKVTAVIRNIDNHLYYVEWSGNKDEKGPQRTTGFITPVAGISFAQLKPLTTDGTIDENYIILRVGMKEGSLIVQNLKDDFFKDKTINSSDDLRKIVEANVENKQMYDGDEMKFTRLPDEASAAK